MGIPFYHKDTKKIEKYKYRFTAEKQRDF